MKKKLDLYSVLCVYLGEMRDKEKMTKFKNFNPMALREKYSIGSINKKNNYSSFWLDDGWDTTSSIFDDEVEVNKKPKVDLVALAGYRRAVSNFVSIVTGDSSIKVNFTSNHFCLKFDL